MFSSFNKLPVVLIGTLAVGVAVSDAMGVGCNIQSIAQSNVVIETAVAESWGAIGRFACGDPEVGTDITEIDDQVTMVATAAARAIAEIRGVCAVSGNGRISTMGSARATARAEAYGRAVSNIFITNDVCPNCTAVASAMVETSMRVIDEATAEAWVAFSLTGNGNDEVVVRTINAAEEEIAEAVATAIASVTGTIRASAQQGCEIEVDPVAQVNDFFGRCNLITTGANRTIETDAIVDLALEVQALACGGESNMELTSLMQGTAQALADAVAQTEITCEASGGEDTEACGFVEAEVTAIAQAEAFAFVQVFAEAGTCGCRLEQFVTVQNVEPIFVNATARAYAEACINGDGADFDQDFDRNVASQMVVGLSQVMVTAITQAREEGQSECNINIRACTNTEMCAPRFGPCRGVGVDGVIPCCRADEQCYRRTETESACRLRSTGPPSFFDGGIDEFPICPAEIDQ